MPDQSSKLDVVLEQIGRAVEGLRERDKSLAAIRDEQKRQASVLQSIQQTLAHLKGSLEGADHAAKIKELEEQYDDLEKDLLRPGGGSG